MKKTSKLMALVLACAMVLGLTACGGNGTPSTGSTGSTPTATENTDPADTTSDKTYQSRHLPAGTA